MKTILVPTESHESMRSALATALLLARRFDSYIEGFALRFRVNEFIAVDMAGAIPLETLREESFDEARRGVIDHALRFTASKTRRAYVYPARHYASNLTDPNLPPMGLRVRLKASFDVTSFPKQTRVILVALKRYGMMVADNGANWFISGAPNAHWNNDDLHSLGRVKGLDFEVVQTGPLTAP